MIDNTFKMEFEETICTPGYKEGYDKGNKDGYVKGKTDGLSEGYENGKTDGREQEKNDFWLKYQGWDETEQRVSRNGSFRYAGVGWTDETFDPKHSMKPDTALGMFRTSHIKNLNGILKRNNVTFDFSECGDFTQFMTYSKIEIVPHIDTRSAKDLTSMFYGSSIKNIQQITFGKGQNLTNMFGECYNLEYILKISGVINTRLEIYHSTKLRKSAIINIFNALTSYLYECDWLVLSEKAVNNAFGIDVKDETTWPEGSEYYNLRWSKPYWGVAYW